MSTQLAVVGLGRMPYEDAWRHQRALAEARIRGDITDDLLLLVEHPPVITLGRSFDPEHLTTSREQLAAQSIDVFEIERGGDVTFHGPGQLVGYPIFRLTEHKKDLHWFLRAIEEALITALDSVGVRGERQEGLTGVWTQGRKIASIGIHVKQWVTWHGFALNVSTKLSYFDLIVPCGIDGVQMTSIVHELGERAPRDLWGRALDGVVLGFSEAFGFQPQATTLEDILARA
jgi:lipoate-protein ligase B